MIGILGGTFDPVHYGHLRTALELYQQLNLEEMRFIPCQKPVLGKTPSATANQRLAMLKLAINHQPGFLIDERELNRNTPSYTVDTLISLRAENNSTPLGLIIGSDNLIELNKWYRWQELMQLAHLIVIPRPDYSFPTTGIMAEFIKFHQTTDPIELKQKPNGCLFMANVAPLSISSTYIRQQIVQGLNPRYLFPDSVLDYIQREKLYL